MRFYIAFDDTDILDCDRGTGKLARWFTEELPPGCSAWGVVRQQLLQSPEIPMTSHNSSLCCVINVPGEDYRMALIELGIRHIRDNYFEGSDPGLCVFSETDKGLENIIPFGIKCTRKKVHQEEALHAAKYAHLSGHGGTNDGIIGAAAAVGLTLYGESGRMVAYRDIRELPELTTAGQLREREIFPVSVNRHAEYIPDFHLIDNQGSLRPHLCGRRLILPLCRTGAEKWKTIGTGKVNDAANVSGQ